jgi:hypothetical protein
MMWRRSPMVLAQSKSSRWSFVGTVFQRISTAAPLGKGSTVVVILSPLNRLIEIDCHPFFVFGKSHCFVNINA